MNSVNAPPQLGNPQAWMLEAAEAHALTYLASYSGGAESGRTTESFKRSFGMTDINYVPSSSFGGNTLIPGIVIATYPDKVVLAAPGATLAFAGLRALVTSNFEAVSGLSGRVFQIYADIAVALQTFLNAGNLLGTPATRRGKRLIFAGYSAGAGIAEILSKLYAADTPTRGSVCYKFGSTRIGNQRYQDFMPQAWQRYNMVLETDPLTSWPGPRFNTVGSTFTSVPTLWSHPVRDPLAYVFKNDGVFVGSYQAGNDQVSGRVELGFLQTFNAANVTWWHDRHKYRVFFANWAGHFSDMLSYRLLGLEFPDDNKFANTWFPGVEWYDGIFGVLGSPPADRIPPQSVANILGRDPVQTVDSDVGAFASGEWGGANDDPTPWQVASPTRSMINTRARRVRRF